MGEVFVVALAHSPPHPLEWIIRSGVAAGSDLLSLLLDLPRLVDEIELDRVARAGRAVYAQFLEKSCGWPITPAHWTVAPCMPWPVSA
jgi:hypothetical protein